MVERISGQGKLDVLRVKNIFSCRFVPTPNRLKALASYLKTSSKQRLKPLILLISQELHLSGGCLKWWGDYVVESQVGGATASKPLTTTVLTPMEQLKMAERLQSTASEARSRRSHTAKLIMPRGSSHHILVSNGCSWSPILSASFRSTSTMVGKRSSLTRSARVPMLSAATG